MLNCADVVLQWMPSQSEQGGDDHTEHNCLKGNKSFNISYFSSDFF